MPDPVQMLIDDHKKVKDLFQQFERADGGREKRKIVEEAIRELRIHSALEEQVLYPAIRAVKEADDIMDEADEEHHMADILMDELESMTPRHSHYDAKFTVLAESVRHHIEEEEGEMFPKAKGLGDERLRSLGEQMSQLKQQLTRNGGAARRSSPDRARSK